MTKNIILLAYLDVWYVSAFLLSYTSKVFLLHSLATGILSVFTFPCIVELWLDEVLVF